MANKLRYELELDSQGYKQGAEQASLTTKELKKSTEDYIKSFGPLKKQMREAKTEAMNLASQFANLSRAEQQSEFGKALKDEMDLAVRKAAELQDVMADTQQAIKNAASDTQTWDALKEGMEIGKSAALAYASAIAQVTGNEEDLAKMVKTLTTIENTFNTAIKIGNALQQQSALMTGIRRLQNYAAGVAEDIATKAKIKNTAATVANTAAERANAVAKGASTKATVAGTAATEGATVAQRVFNAVAKANPYVLLATVAIAAATAIGGYMLATSKSTAAEKAAQAQKEQLANANKKYSDTFVSEMTKMVSKYKELQVSWNNLKSTHEKNQFIKDNKEQFDEYRQMLGKAATEEEILKKYTEDIKQAFIQRAKAAALSAKAVELYSQAYTHLSERQQLIDKRNAELRQAKKDFDEYNKMSMGAAKLKKRLQMEEKYGLTNITDLFDFSYDSAKSNIIKKYNSDIDAGRDAFNDLIKEADSFIDKSIEVGGVVSKTSTTISKATKEQKTHVDELNNKIKDLETKKANVNPLSSNAQKDIENYNKQIRELKSELEDYKTFIEFGISQESYNQLRAYSQQINNLETQLDNLDPKMPDYSKIASELRKQIKKITNEKEEYKISIGVNVDTKKIDALEKWKQEIKDIEVILSPTLDESKANKIWDKIRTQQEKISNLQIQYNAELDPQKKEQIKAQIKDLYKYIGELKAELNIGMNAEKAKKTIDNIDKLRESADLLESFIIEPKLDDAKRKEVQDRLAVLKNKENELQRVLLQPNLDEATRRKTENELASIREEEDILEDIIVKPELDEDDLSEIENHLTEVYDKISKLLRSLPVGLDEQSVRDLLSRLDNLKEQVEQREIDLGVKVEPKSDGKDVKKVQDILNDVNKKITPPKYDFEFIPDDSKNGKKAKELLDKYNTLTDARERLINIMNTSTDDQAIHDAQIGIDGLNESISELEPELDKLDKLNEKYKAFTKISEASGKAGQYLGDLASSFSKLGEATQNTGIQAVGIIMETIANLALSFSKAMIQASEFGPWAWIAFAIAGTAQLAATIAQIKSLTAGSYAEGGVVPGSSFTGDKLLARVNSGERILTAKQNENLEKIANNTTGQGIVTEQRIQVIGKIKGTDILLVSKNTNKLLSKSGTNISF